LDDDNLLVRDLAFWHLDRLGVGGRLPEKTRKIDYDLTSEPEKRQQAVEQWKKLLREGKMPLPPVRRQSGHGLLVLENESAVPSFPVRPSGRLRLRLDHFEISSWKFDAIPIVLPKLIVHQVKTSPSNANRTAILDDLPRNGPGPHTEPHLVTDMNGS